MTRTNNVVIFGVGALGSLFAASLSNLRDTYVFAFGNWQEHLTQVCKNGLILKRPDGTSTRSFVRMSSNLHDLPAADIALCLVKSYQTERTAKQIRNILKPNGVAVTLQNGLGNAERLTEVLGQKRVYTGITLQAAHVPEPGTVVHAGTGLTTIEQKNDTPNAIHEVNRLFNQAGLESWLTADIQQEQWRKLIINAGINALTALLEVRNGNLLQDSLVKNVLFAAAEEVFQVARGVGVSLKGLDSKTLLQEACQKTANNYSSMLKDMLNGRPTEIDAISGAVVEYAKQRQIATPINRFLYECVKTKQNGGSFNYEQLQTLANL